jgi:hypothetical protein
MKTIASALLALSVLAGVAASVAPASAETLGQQLEREGRFGHAI